MLSLALLVASIGIADSINPSTVVPALYLATAPRGRGLASFALGVFAVYLCGGLVLVLGPGPALISALQGIGPSLEHVTEAVFGAAALVFAFVIWRSRKSSPAGERPPRSHTRRSAFALGAAISAVELPTAFMYFGAVSAVLDSHFAASAQVSLVVAYNVLFVLPLLAILGLRQLAGERAEARLAATRAGVLRAAPVALAAVAGVAGVAFLGIGATGLVRG